MQTPYTVVIEQQMQRYYTSLSERDRRRYAAIEAVKLGHGGISYISRVLSCDYRTIKLGMQELRDETALPQPRIRRPGGGRKRAFDTIDGLDEAFLRVIADHTAGSPMDDAVKWTHLTRGEIAQLLQHQEAITVSVTVIDQLLAKHHYRRRQAQKTRATGSHPQRNEQFETIQRLKQQYQAEGNPVLSMDTKKKN
jgi:hypothetical protein